MSARKTHDILGILFLMGIATCLLLACSSGGSGGGEETPFFTEGAEPTYTIQVEALPQSPMKDDDTVGLWTYPTTVTYTSTLNVPSGGSLSLGDQSRDGYDFHVTFHRGASVEILSWTESESGNMYMDEAAGTGQDYYLEVQLGGSSGSGHSGHGDYEVMPTYHHIEVVLYDDGTTNAAVSSGTATELIEDAELNDVQTKHGFRWIKNFDLVNLADPTDLNGDTLAAGDYDLHVEVKAPELRLDHHAKEELIDAGVFPLEADFDLSWDGAKFFDPTDPAKEMPAMEVTVGGFIVQARFRSSTKNLYDHGVLQEPSSTDETRIEVKVYDTEMTPHHSDQLVGYAIRITITNGNNNASTTHTLNPAYSHSFGGHHYGDHVQIPLTGGSGAGSGESGEGGGGHAH